MGLFVEHFHSAPFAQGFIHDKLTFAGGFGQHLHQFIQGFLIESPWQNPGRNGLFQGADGFLKRFFIVLADAHHFADSPHLRAQFVFNPGEFFKGPSGEFDDHIIARGGIFFQGALPPVGDFVQGQAAGQQRRNQRDGKAGGFGSQGGRTRSPRV